MQDYLQEAQELLNSLGQIKLSLEERQSLSIELASLMIKGSFELCSEEKRKKNLRIVKSLQDLNVRAFIFNLIDHAFRSKNNQKSSRYLRSLIERYNITPLLPLSLRFKLFLFKIFAKTFPRFCVSFLKKEIYHLLFHMMGVQEKEKFLKNVKESSFPINSVYLKEKVLSKEEAEENLSGYLNWLLEDKITYLSLKVSAISAEINFPDSKNAIDSITNNLKEIYRVASYDKENPKTVFLEMENYNYLYPALNSFKKALEEFPHLKAGITLQAYLPESFAIQEELTNWAKERVQKGGAPIELLLVKGSYLSLEQIEASKKGWPQAPFASKIQTDANFKRMLAFGLQKENASFVHITIGTHNIFDLAYSLILMKENNVENYTFFQIVKGQGDHLSKMLHRLVKNHFRLGAVFIEEKDFISALPYVIRRLEELTGPENFLKNALDIYPGTADFDNFQAAFLQSFEEIKNLSSDSKRFQNRKTLPVSTAVYVPFDNESNTDFSLPINQQWKNQILKQWQNYAPSLIPLCIGGEFVNQGEEKNKNNPSNPYLLLYKYILASPLQIQTAIDTAKKNEESWRLFPVEKKKEIIAKAAQILREKRADFIGALMLDTAKILHEADTEISQAIDMMEYYLLRVNKLLKINDVIIKPKGTIGIFSSRAFPLSVPTGGIVAALITGNCVLFRPAADAVFSGWMLSSILWQAGIPKEVLQFINCDEEASLIKDPRLSSLVLTGKSVTVEKFLNLNPLLDLNSASEGKNMFIVSAFSDRKRAIKNLLSSAFAYSGQKYSSVSIAILEKEVFEDEQFLKTLKEAASNLKVGSIWQEETQIGPLIHKPDKNLLKALTELEEDEKWLLKPQQDPHNPNLFSPGIKLNIKINSFFFKNFLPGPVLGIMKADSFEHAMAIANSTKYGLSSVLDSLNDIEIFLWQRAVEAGNYYCNRDSHGSIIRRQPFGGHKKSSYGLEFKAGGPNYLLAFLVPHQGFLPKEKRPVSEKINNLASLLEKIDLSTEELGIWYASIANYAYWWNRMKLPRDPNKIVGEDNFFGYIPREHLTLRIYKNDPPLNILRIAAAALTCKINLEVSFDSALFEKTNWQSLSEHFKIIDESEEAFLNRIREKKIKRIRLASKASDDLKTVCSLNLCYADDFPVLANGRWELLHYLKEISLAYDYHRFGNLGIRSAELRKPLL